MVYFYIRYKTNSLHRKISDERVKNKILGCETCVPLQRLKNDVATKRSTNISDFDIAKYFISSKLLNNLN